jgi:tetratricopeptide (TPR) repeat protein
MHDAHQDEIAKLERLYSENPEGRIFTHLAEAYRKAGELDRAAEVLRSGLERHPDYSSAHVVMGRVLVDQGRADDAEWEFRRVLELDPHNLVALRSLGDIARAEGRRDTALEHYNRLLEVEPADDQVRGYIEELTAGQESGVGEGWGESPEVQAWEPELLMDDQDQPADVAEPARDVEPADDAEPAWPALDGPADEEEDEPLPPPTTMPGVMTETIARVYARQGLYDQAAEVYRELLRARPDDAGLREQLEEMERLAEGADAYQPLEGLETQPEQPLETHDWGHLPEPEPREPAGDESADWDPDAWGESLHGAPEPSSASQTSPSETEPEWEMPIGWGEPPADEPAGDAEPGQEPAPEEAREPFADYEPFGEHEPSAGEEPSAEEARDPFADYEPFAEREPSAGEEPSAEEASEPFTDHEPFGQHEAAAGEEPSAEEAREPFADYEPFGEHEAAAGEGPSAEEAREPFADYEPFGEHEPEPGEEMAAEEASEPFAEEDSSDEPGRPRGIMSVTDITEPSEWPERGEVEAGTETGWPEEAAGAGAEEVEDSVWLGADWPDQAEVPDATPYAWTEAEAPPPDDSAPIRSYFACGRLTTMTWTRSGPGSESLKQ